MRSRRCRTTRPTRPTCAVPWLNIYDSRDFLSFLAEPLFRRSDGLASVVDLRVRSGKDFPKSHGAYWELAPVWDAIATAFSWKRVEPLTVARRATSGSRRGSAPSRGPDPWPARNWCCSSRTRRALAVLTTVDGAALPTVTAPGPADRRAVRRDRRAAWVLAARAPQKAVGRMTEDGDPTLLLVDLETIGPDAPPGLAWTDTADLDLATAVVPELGAYRNGRSRGIATGPGCSTHRGSAPAGSRAQARG